MTWLRAMRNTRLLIWEGVMIVSSLALMGSAVGMCWAIWSIVGAVINKGR